MLAASPEKTEQSIAFWTKIRRNNDMKAAEIEPICDKDDNGDSCSVNLT